jgi:hypothetical protein
MYWVWVPTTLKECQFVLNHFNKAKSLGEIPEIIHRSYYTVQNIVEMYEKENRLTSKVRKSSMKIFSVTKDGF